MEYRVKPFTPLVFLHLAQQEVGREEVVIEEM
jgi:hypothetical protein